MSGHSKWSTIKHQKAATDQRRGKVFSKLAKAISMAVKEGGNGDLESNPKLKFIIEKAKAVNLPKENIQRAIDKGLGKGGAGILEVMTYEGFGPEKIAVLVECVTDSKNRTAQEIKSLFEKEGGHMGQPGSTAYLFEKKGLILIKKSQDVESQLLSLIDLGALDVEEAGDLVEVFVMPDKLEEMKQKLIIQGISIKEANLTYIASSPIIISKPNVKDRVINFLNAVDDLEDVQKVYTNAEFQVVN